MQNQQQIKQLLRDTYHSIKRHFGDTYPHPGSVLSWLESLEDTIELLEAEDDTDHREVE
jgi:hypothetical protein